MARIKNLNYYYNNISVNGFKKLVEEVVRPGFFKEIVVDDVVYDETLPGGLVKIYYHISGRRTMSGKQVLEWNGLELGNFLSF